ARRSAGDLRQDEPDHRLHCSARGDDLRIREDRCRHSVRARVPGHHQRAGPAVQRSKPRQVSAHGQGGRVKIERRQEEVSSVATSNPPDRPLSELAAMVGGEIVGDPQLRITGGNGLAQASPSELSFYANRRYREELERSRAGAILIGADVPLPPVGAEPDAERGVPKATAVDRNAARGESIPVRSQPAKPSFVKVAFPHLAFAKISWLFHPRPSFAPGVSPRAHVHAQARIHPEATVMAGATVERGASI